MKRYRVPLLISLVVIAVFIGWRVREATDGTYQTQWQLQQVPEEHLFYPGAVVLGTSGRDYEWGIWGNNPAISGYLLGASASSKEIEAFYIVN
ncbi:MAG TPA: hypothetical protein VIL85_19100 [Thermomicrobiales bacterium]|jgi:hypothetical protein